MNEFPRLSPLNHFLPRHYPHPINPKNTESESVSHPLTLHNSSSTPQNLLTSFDTVLPFSHYIPMHLSILFPSLYILLFSFLIESVGRRLVVVRILSGLYLFEWWFDFVVFVYFVQFHVGYVG